MLTLNFLCFRPALLPTRQCFRPNLIKTARRVPMGASGGPSLFGAGGTGRNWLELGCKVCEISELAVAGERAKRRIVREQELFCRCKVVERQRLETIGIASEKWRAGFSSRRLRRAGLRLHPLGAQACWDRKKLLVIRRRRGRPWKRAEARIRSCRRRAGGRIGLLLCLVGVAGL